MSTARFPLRFPAALAGIEPVRQHGSGGVMGTDDKVRNEAEEWAGKAKEGVGKATDDERLEAEGKGDQVKANLKQAGEKVKDAFRD
jgi:uncharacterized protein YjbJ (UPF0337 family)